MKRIREFYFLENSSRDISHIYIFSFHSRGIPCTGKTASKSQSLLLARPVSSTRYLVLNSRTTSASTLRYPAFLFQRLQTPLGAYIHDHSQLSFAKFSGLLSPNFPNLFPFRTFLFKRGFRVKAKVHSVHSASP